MALTPQELADLQAAAALMQGRTQSGLGSLQAGTLTELDPLYNYAKTAPVLSLKGNTEYENLDFQPLPGTNYRLVVGGDVIGTASSPAQVAALVDAANKISAQGGAAVDVRLQQEVQAATRSGEAITAYNDIYANKENNMGALETLIPLALSVMGGAALGPLIQGGSVAGSASALGAGLGTAAGSLGGNLLVGNNLEESLIKAGISGLTAGAIKGIMPGGGTGGITGTEVPFTEVAPTGSLGFGLNAPSTFIPAFTNPITGALGAAGSSLLSGAGNEILVEGARTGLGSAASAIGGSLTPSVFNAGTMPQFQNVDLSEYRYRQEGDPEGTFRDQNGVLRDNAYPNEIVVTANGASPSNLTAGIGGGAGNLITVTNPPPGGANAETAGGAGNLITVTNPPPGGANAETAGGAGNLITVTNPPPGGANAETAGGAGNLITVTNPPPGGANAETAGGAGNLITVTNPPPGGANAETAGGAGNLITVTNPPPSRPPGTRTVTDILTGSGADPTQTVTGQRQPVDLLAGISDPVADILGDSQTPTSTKQKILSTLKTIAGLTPLIPLIGAAVGGGGGGGGTLDAGPGLPVGGIGGGRGRIPATFDPFTYGQREGEFEFFRNAPATTGTVTGIGGTGATGTTTTGTTGATTTGTTTAGTPGPAATAAEVSAAFPGYTNIRQAADGRWFGEPIPGYTASGPAPTGLRVTAAGTFNPTVDDYRFFNPGFESIEPNAAGQYVGSRTIDVPGLQGVSLDEIRTRFPGYENYEINPAGQFVGTRTTSRTPTLADYQAANPGFTRIEQGPDGQYYGFRNVTTTTPGTLPTLDQVRAANPGYENYGINDAGQFYGTRTVTEGPALAEGGEVDDDMVRHLIEYRKGGGHMGPGQVKGIGSGQEDKIPAWLSDGEYVWSAQDVADLGDGSTDEGVRRLDRMRKMVRQRAGRKDVKKIAKPQRGIEDMLKAVGGAV
jgi:hypothetical protein